MASPTALPAIAIRLDPVKRLALADHLVDLCTAAIVLQHDEAAKLARIDAARFHAPKTDRVLLRGISTLTAFVKDRAEDGIGLPTWHPCYVVPAVWE